MIRRFTFLIMILPCLFVAQAGFGADAPTTLQPPAGGWPSDYELIEARRLIAASNYEGALDVLSRLTNRNLRLTDAHVLSGLAHMKLNNIKKAEQSLNYAITVDPRHIGAHVYHAELDLLRGDINEATERLQAIRTLCKGTDCAEYMYLNRMINTANKDAKSRELMRNK